MVPEMEVLVRKLVYSLFLVLTVATSVAQQDKLENKKRELYSAVAVMTGGSVDGQTVKVDISIDRYTADKELGDYLMLLLEEDQAAALEKLEKVEVGQINPGSEPGTALCVARFFELNGQKVIRLLTTRPILKRYRGEHSEDHPFTMIEIRLDADGSGSGSVKGGTRIKFENGLLSFERQGNRYAQLAKVRARD
jgi:hypothetical protein